VVRRQFFWSAFTNTTVTGGSPESLYPLQIFFDDPAYWQSYH
jgi:hypothetical protein